MCMCCHLELAGEDGKLEGKVPSADCLVGQCTAGQATRPINASLLLRFNRGNVLFISHPTSGDLAAWMALMPKGSWLPAAASSCLSTVGVLTAKGQR